MQTNIIVVCEALVEISWLMTYELLGVARREAHAITRLRLVVKVGASLQEAEHAVHEGVQPARLLRHRHEHLVEFCQQGWR